ncbi:MAG: DegT/DnrJ/EryC1/StrS family aminotransferase [Promethearchaeota archaeon]
MDTSWASEGPLVKQFEDNWNKKFGYADSVSMSSGTDADINACLALYDEGARHGDEVICPALTFVATVNSVLLAGFTPTFADIDRNTLNVDPQKVADAVTDKTRAIMVTHTMGKPCDMDAIMSIARERDLFVIEDACEAHGAQYKGNYIGTFGHVVTFSYYAAHIVVCGEGGMCSTQYPEMADILRSTKSHGRRPGSIYFDFLRIGLNSKMNDLEAAIGLEGLEQFDSTIENRVVNRAQLMDSLTDLQNELWLPNLGGDEFVSPHAFPIVFKKDNPDRCSEFYKFLESNSIQCKTLFGSMPTQHEAFKSMGYHLGDFPEAEFVGNNGVHFGIHQYLTEDDIEYVAHKIHDFLG